MAVVCMSLWTGVSLAATLMHATSPIYRSAFPEGTNTTIRGIQTWAVSLISGRLSCLYFLLRCLYDTLGTTTRRVTMLPSYELPPVGWASETYYAIDRTICEYVSLVNG